MCYGDYPDLQNVNKILVIKLRHLGDVLLSCPVFRVLRSVFPEAKIDAYIYKEAFPILEGHPAIDRLIGYDRQERGFCKELRLLWDFRQAGYDLVINLTEGDRGIVASRISGAPVRVGFRPKGGWQKKSLTHVAKDCPSLRHTVERNLDVLRRIGIFPQPEERELEFHIPASARQRIRELMGDDPFVVIHPTSRWRFKCWSIANMRKLAMRLMSDGKKVVLSAGKDEAELKMADEIAKGTALLNLAGSLSLKELGALIDAAELLVSVDSVPFHLANALKKPVVALFGPTSEITWGPWKNPHAKIVAHNMSCRPCYQDGCGGSKKSDCLDLLSVDMVLDAIYNRKSSPK